MQPSSRSSTSEIVRSLVIETSTILLQQPPRSQLTPHPYGGAPGHPQADAGPLAAQKHPQSHILGAPEGHEHGDPVARLGAAVLVIAYMYTIIYRCRYVDLQQLYLLTCSSIRSCT
jgi:hypothetical protein